MPDTPSFRVHPFSGCCHGARLGLDETEKKRNPRGEYFGCMKCGKYVSRMEAVFELKTMRRTLAGMGYTRLRKPQKNAEDRKEDGWTRWVSRLTGIFGPGD